MKIRKQTYSLDLYLKLMRNETIRSDADVQRLSGQWNNNMAGELISTVLAEGYIPPLILGEETANKITKLWIIDGLQRSTTLAMFRYGNARIARSIDEYMITYQRKILDENGSPKRDEHNEILWESVQYDIRNKTYSQLPEELRDRFDSFQFETVIHQGCDMAEVSKFVRRYNNHTAMNTNQKAFTYIDNFARELRHIAGNRFFSEVYSSSQKGRTNGFFERISGDIVLLCNYPDKYWKNTKTAFRWLNENAALYDFESVDNLLTRLTDAISPVKETHALFTSKNASIFVATFKKCTEMGMDDAGYGKFLKWFMRNGKKTVVNGQTWDILDAERATRDPGVVHRKVDYLAALMELYFREIQEVA